MLTGNSSVNYKTKNKGGSVGTKLYYTDSPSKPRTRLNREAQELSPEPEVTLPAKQGKASS